MNHWNYIKIFGGNMKNKLSFAFTLSLTVFFGLSFASSAMATIEHWKSFKATYPNAKAIAKCQLCHEFDENGHFTQKRNPYGQDYEKALYDFKAIELLDSDGDTFDNITEINANTFPGDKESHPESE